MDSPVPRVLIIEDNPDDRDLLLRQLQKKGMADHVKVIHDGRVAMDFLARDDDASNQVIALFLDLNLPSVSGLQLLEKVRSNPRRQHLPVIVMTSSNAPEDLNRC